jgi:hypothetical protein
MIGSRAYRAFWCEVALMLAMTARDVTEICFGNMGRILGKWRDLHGESFPLSRRESQTRTRGRVTTTTSSAAPFTQGQEDGHDPTKSRGTPIDADDSRGTGLRIIHIVTSSRGEGVEISDDKKKRGRLTPPSKIVQRAYSRSRTFPLQFHPFPPNVTDWELAKLDFPSQFAFTTPRLCKSN